MGEGQPAGVEEPVVRVEDRERVGVGDGGSSTGRSSSNGSKKSSAAGRIQWSPRVGVVTGTSMRLGLEGIEDGRGSLWWVGRSILEGEGENRGGEGWCGEKGFWVSGIREEVGVEGCVDGAGEGGLTGSESRVETVEGEDVGA